MCLKLAPHMIQVCYYEVMNPEQPKNTNQENQSENTNEISNFETVNIPPKPRKNLLKMILISILGLIIILVVVFIVQTGVVTQKIAASRSTAERTADKKLEQIENLVAQAGITDKQIASSKIDICYVTHTDQGWTVSSYYQDCYLRYIQGYTTKLSKDELKQKLLAQQEAQTLFNEEYRSLAAVLDECELYHEALTFTPSKGELTYRPANVTDEEYSCKVPNPLRGLWSVRGPFIIDDALAAKIYRTYDITRIDNSTNQFWLSFDEHYYHEDLGCIIGGIFCGNPRPTPIQAP